jgi:hypothetical protein
MPSSMRYRSRSLSHFIEPCLRALVFGQTDEGDKPAKEVTETFFHGSVGQRPSFIEDALRTGYENSPLRPELDQACAKRGAKRSG